MADSRDSSTELLDTARQVLLEQILPELQGARRYDALMIANAMAIAARLARLDASEPDDLRALRRRLIGEADPGQAASLLAAAIRDGRIGPDNADLRELLMKQTVQLLRVSNPRYLESYNLA